MTGTAPLPGVGAPATAAHETGGGNGIGIARATLGLIHAEAEQAYPAECCGLLVGPAPANAAPAPARRIARAVPCANIARDPARTFEVDPQARIDLERALRGGREAVIGHYHSHPDAPASPSERDRARAFEERHVWLIAAVADGRCTAIRAFTPDGRGAFHEISLFETDGGS